jgi:outer membrane protein assembly factor BamB
MLWSYQTGSASYVRSSPAVINGIVYVGTDDTRLYAIYANNGSAKWTFNAANIVRTSPVVVDGVVYFGSDTRFYAVNATTGTYIWFKNTGAVRSSPAVIDGVVYFGSDYTYFWALDAATGNTIKRLEIGFPVKSSPTIVQGVAYFGANHHVLYAFNIGTGNTVWSAALNGNVESCPVVAGDIVYAITTDGTLYALDTANGAQQWSKAVGATDASPIVIGNTIYVGSENKFYAFNATDGAEVWSYTSDGGFMGTPSFSDGVVYVGGEDGKVYAFADAQFTLTMNTVGQGSVLPGNGTNTGGASVDLVAIPSAGWVFSGWSGDASGTSNTTITMNTNKTVAATFILEPVYDVIFTASGLASGTSWNVTLDGDTQTSTSSTITFNRVSGSYNYTVATPAGYVPLFNMSATLTVTAANVNISLEYLVRSLGNWTYGGANNEKAFSIIETIDGGYAIAGYTASYGAGGNDFWLVKVNSSGIMQWNKTYGGSGADVAFGIVASSDGGYALAGYTASYGAGGNDVWLVKVDSNGTLQWSKTYGGNKADSAYCLVATSDGGYAIAGSTYSYGAGDADVWLIKVDSNGNTEWSKTYGGTGEDVAYSLVTVSDGGYALAGYTRSYGAGSYDFWLVKVSSSGNMEWNKTFGGTAADTAYGLTATVDGGFVIAGSTASYGAGNNDVWLIKVDSAGNALWNTTYGQSGSDIAYGIVASTDGGYTATGSTASYGAGSDDVWLIRVDSSGNALWNRTYGGSGADVARSLVLCADGGYALAGCTTSYGAGNNDFFFLLKDCNGRVFDEYALTVVTVGAGSVNSVNGTYTAGTCVDLIAVAADGWTFGGWSGDASGSTNTSIPMTGDKTVTATFIQSTYTVTFTQTGLASGTSWSVTFNGNTQLSATDTISFTGINNGNFAYSIATPAGYTLESPSATGTITVSGDNVSRSVSFTPIPANDWPMFQHDPQHSGYINASGPTSNHLLWTIPEAGIKYFPAAAVDGVVYAASDSQGIFAFNATTGATIWNTLPMPFFSAPAVVNGVVYTGSASDGYIYALDAVDGSTIWSSNVGVIYASTTVVNGVVYLTGQSIVGAVNASTGTELWKTHTSSLSTAPVIFDGKFYYGTDSGYIIALNAETGTEEWNYPTGSEIYSSPAIANGILYIGATSGTLYALNATNGYSLWTYSAPNAIRSSPAVANGVVYVGSDDGSLYAVNANTGLYMWSFLTGGQIRSAISVANDVVYFGSNDFYIYAVNTTDGTELWNYQTQSEVQSSIAISNGNGYISSDDGTFYAFGGEYAQYTLTMYTVGQGTVTPGNYTYLEGGGSVILRAYPAQGWSFSGWSGDASGSSTTTSVPEGNKTVTATFVENTYTLTMITVGSGTVNLGNVTTYHYGDLVDIKAINAAEWVFGGWSGDASGTANTTLTMTANMTVTATFTQDTIQLTVNSAVGGLTTPSSGVYNSTLGSTESVSATPSFGYQFSHWLLDGSINSTSTTINLTMDGNHTVTPVFSQITYTLTIITVGSGSVLPGNQSYALWSSVDIEAISDAGWTFSGWSGDASGSSNTTISMNGNKIVTATFVENTYTLSMITVGDGSVSPGNVTTYHYGETVDIKAINAAGWSFVNWTGDASGASNTTITMDGNKTVTATFIENTYTLTMITIGSGTVSPGNVTTYYYGDSVNIEASSSAGWVFSGWSGDASGVSSTSLVMTANKTVTATFTLIPTYSVIFTASGLASGTNWAVTLDGNTLSSTTSTVTFTGLLSGTFDYTIHTPDGYLIGTASTGSVAVAGSNVDVPVTFSSLSGTEWYKFRHDILNTGTHNTTGPLTNQIKWTYTTDNTVFGVYSSPSIVNGVVYVGATDGKTYALNASNGTQIWNYNTGTAVYSSPCVVGGLVYVGSGNKLYGLNATDGTLIWSYTTGSQVFSSPSVVDGVVYVGSYDGKVYALNATDGALVWSYSTGDSIEASPAVVDGVVYIGSRDGKVYALNASAGTVIWSSTKGNAIKSSPSVVNGVVYIGSNGEDDGYVYALNASDGTQIWGRYMNRFVISSPSVAAGIVYIGSNDYYVYALNASNGNLVWSYKTGRDVQSSACIVDGVVYIGSNDGKLYAFGYVPQFTLTINTVGSGSVSPGNQTYTDGASVDLVAIAAAGWSFAGWTGDASGAVNTTITMNGNKTVTATFVENTYTLTMITVGSGTVNPGNVTTYHYGDTVDIKAINAQGWSFSGWSGDVTGSSNTTITINANKTVTATFTRFSATVNGETSGHVAESITYSGSGYSPNTDYYLTFGGYYIADINTNSSGGFTYTTTVMKIMGAEWTVELVNSLTTLSVATTQFTVLPSLTLNVTSAPSGTTVSIVATGLMSGTPTIGDNLTATFNGATITLNSPQSSGWGDFNATFTVPLLALGNYTLRITDNTGDNLTATFRVTGYTITVNQNSHGTISPSTAEYTTGTNQTYTITPDIGYHILDVVVDNVSKGAVTSWQFSHIAENHTITAIYVLDEYTLTATTSGNGTVTKNPNQTTYHYGDVVELTATPGAGWSFSAWTGDASGTATITSITMTGNKTVTATFVENTYTLTMVTIGNGNVSPGNVTTYHYGDSVDIKAINAFGWSFSGWSGHASGSANTTINMNSNKTITATFTQNTYTLTMITVGQGSVSPGNQSYLSGTSVDLRATNVAGWTFSGWSGDTTGATNTTIVMNSDFTITATFTQDIYSLTIITEGNGNVLPGNQSYLSGTNIDLKAINSAGWSFTAWSGDASGAANTTITMNSNKIITATFTENTYTLTMIIFGNGNISPGNVTTYHYGDTANINAVNALGWYFSGWTGDVSGAANTTITLNANKTITATFLPNIYTINMTYTGNGHVDFNATQPYSYGQTVSLTPVADPGWSFYGWSGDAQGSSNPLILTMTVNMTITAVFTQNTYTLTMITVGNGQVLPGNATTYTYSDNVDLKAIATAGWSFNGWTGDATGTSNTTITMIANKTVTATFTENTYTLTMLTVGNGNVNLGNVTNYHYGDTVDLKATNAYGWTFTGWSGDATGATNTTITMNVNKTITATFTQNIYTLTMLTVGNGNVSPGNQTYLSGTNVTISANPAQGWQIVSISYGYTNNTIITMNGNLTVVVNFTIQSVYVPPITPPITPTTVTLNIAPPSVGGTTTPANGSYTYNTNVLVQVTATPNPGYCFAYWIVDNNPQGSNSTLTLNMTSNHTVQAIFANNTYTLTVITQGQGTVNPINSSYRYGELVSLDATAASGWNFAGWSGDATGVSNAAITMDANKTVTATFTQNTYSLTIITTGSGAVSPGNHSYLSGTTVNLQALSSSGWTFSGWSGDASGQSDTTLAMDSNKTVYATFTQTTCTLTILTTGQGSVSPGNQTCLYGSIVDLTANAAPGWSFSGWSGDASAAVATSIAMDSNKVVTATFTRNTYTVSFSASGIAADYSGAVLTVDGVAYNLADLPLSFNWQYGSSHSYQFGSTLDASTTKRYVCNAISGLSSTQNGALTVTQAGTITASYETQYHLTVQTSQGTANGGGWYSAGSTATVSVQASTVQSTDNTRYVLSGWSGSASGSGTTVSVLMDGAKSVTAEWTKQYYITINENPSGAAASLTSSTWVPAGTITLTASAGGNYNFTSWTTTGDVTIASTSSASTTAAVNGAATITANFDQPVQTIIATVTTNSETYTVQLGGNITSSQMTNLTITPQPTTSSTIVEFTVTGKSGDHGFGNLTLSKDAIPYGAAPVIYIDGVQVANQGYTEDANYYYVWYITSFSTHTVTIQFTTSTNEPTPVPTASTQPNDYSTAEFNPAFAAVFALVIAFIAVAVLYWRRKQKQ